MRLTLSGNDAIELRTRRVAATFAVTTVILALLALFSVLTSRYSLTRTTVIYEWQWTAAYFAALSIVLTSATFLYGKATIRATSLKMLLGIVAGTFGFAVLTAFAIYSGVPILLHYLASTDGELTVTVSAKEEYERKRTCEPRLFIEEFTFPIFNYICPDNKMYGVVKVGSHVQLKGRVSQFGITANQVIFISDDQEH